LLKKAGAGGGGGMGGKAAFGAAGNDNGMEAFLVVVMCRVSLPLMTLLEMVTVF